MSKRVGILGMVIGTLALASTAQAAFITGRIDFGGQSLTVDSSGVSVSKDTATAIDFVLNSTASGVTTPGVAGNLNVSSRTGDFSSIAFGTIGLISDFSFVGPGNLNFPYPPPTIVGQQLITSAGFSFDLASIFIDTQTSTQLGLHGFGTMNLTNFDPTPGEFFFSTQGTGTGTFSFSSTDEVLPEPGSMILLGTGLLGIGLSVRRRWFGNL